MPIITKKKASPTGLILYTREPIAFKAFEQFAFWSLLNAAQQGQLEEETANLLNAQLQLGLSSIEIGRRLVNIQLILAPYRGAFSQLLDSLHVSSRTLRRYMATYKLLLDHINQPVLDAMIAHGFTLRGATDDRPLGEYTEAYLALTENNEPPPEYPDEDTVISYVNRLELQHERLKADHHALSLVKRRVEKAGNESMRAIRNSKEFLLKQNHHLLTSSLRRLPSNQRDDFLEKHVGYALTLRGVSGKRFEAQAVPAHYNRQPGRPDRIYEEG